MLAAVLVAFGMARPAAADLPAGIVTADSSEWSTPAPQLESPFFIEPATPVVPTAHTVTTHAAVPGTLPDLSGTIEPASAAKVFQAPIGYASNDTFGCCDRWVFLPEEVLFKPFVAGIRSPRLAAEIVYDGKADESYFQSVLGGSFDLVRYGTTGPNAEGWSFGVNAAAHLRQNADNELDVDAVDFKVRVPISYRRGATAIQFGYDHISSHAGDEFLIRTPGFNRINFLRDSLVFAIRHDVACDLNVYAEIDYGVNTDFAEPWWFQAGFEYTPGLRPGWRGAPILAVNGQWREEFDFDGSLNIIAGWQWQAVETDNLIRLAFRYYTGNSEQFSFFTQNEELIGFGLYYDF